MKHRLSLQLPLPAAQGSGFWAPLLLLALASAAPLLLSSCKKSGANAKPADVDYYTCTMHPSVRSQNPNAKCPICSMDLVPVKKKGPSGGTAGGQTPKSSEGAMTNMPGMEPTQKEDGGEHPTEFT